MLQIYIETYGCANNKAESEIMAGLLERAGMKVVSVPKEADILIVNTCDVKLTTRNKVLHRLRTLASLHGEERLIIAGCMPEIEYYYLKSLFPKASLLSTNYVDEIVKAVSKVLEGKRVEYVGYRRCEKVGLPRVVSNEIVRIVPICSGCNSACTFCATKLAKGPLYSFDEEKIIGEILLAKESGAKEFWLTGQDVACYGIEREGRSRLPQLLENITKRVRGRYYIRVGMMNPKNVLPIVDELLQVMEHENVFKFFHLPVQSGSDEILKKMRRDYSVGDFVTLVQRIRNRFPLSSLWTDIIVAFPTESEKDFGLSCKLVDEVGFDYVNVSRFSPHKATAASSLPQLPTSVAKARSRCLSLLVRRTCERINRKWIGWEGEAIVDEYISKKRSYIARNFAYKPIVIDDAEVSLGEWIDVRVVASTHSCLIGKVI